MALRAARALAAASGGFALAGQAAEFPTARRMAAEVASFTLEGQDVDLIAGNTPLEPLDVPFYRHGAGMPLYPPGDPRNNAAPGTVARAF